MRHRLTVTLFAVIICLSGCRAGEGIVPPAAESAPAQSGTEAQSAPSGEPGPAKTEQDPAPPPGQLREVPPVFDGQLAEGVTLRQFQFTPTLEVVGEPMSYGAVDDTLWLDDGRILHLQYRLVQEGDERQIDALLHLLDLEAGTVHTRQIGLARRGILRSVRQGEAGILLQLYTGALLLDHNLSPLRTVEGDSNYWAANDDLTLYAWLDENMDLRLSDRTSGADRLLLEQQYEGGGEFIAPWAFTADGGGLICQNWEGGMGSVINGGCVVDLSTGAVRELPGLDLPILGLVPGMKDTLWAANVVMGGPDDFATNLRYSIAAGEAQVLPVSSNYGTGDGLYALKPFLDSAQPVLICPGTGQVAHPEAGSRYRSPLDPYEVAGTVDETAFARTLFLYDLEQDARIPIYERYLVTESGEDRSFLLTAVSPDRTRAVRVRQNPESGLYTLVMASW